MYNKRGRKIKYAIKKIPQETEVEVPNYIFDLIGYMKKSCLYAIDNKYLIQLCLG